MESQRIIRSKTCSSGLCGVSRTERSVSTCDEGARAYSCESTGTCGLGVTGTCPFRSGCVTNTCASSTCSNGTCSSKDCRFIIPGSKKIVGDDPLAALCRIGLRKTPDIFFAPSWAVHGGPSSYSASDSTVTIAGTPRTTKKSLELSSILYSFDVLDVEVPPISRGLRVGFCGIIYISITDTAGEWVSYIQRARETAEGYGMVDRSTDGEFDYNDIVTRDGRFQPFYGDSQSGDINIEHEAFISTVLNESGEYVSVVLSDSSSADPYIVAYTASRVLQEGGNMVLRLTNIDEGLVYLVSHIFTQVTLFRPLFSSIYLVCLDFIPNMSIQAVLFEHIRVVPDDEVFRIWFRDITKRLIEQEVTPIDEMIVFAMMGV